MSFPLHCLLFMRMLFASGLSLGSVEYPAAVASKWNLAGALNSKAKGTNANTLWTVTSRNAAGSPLSIHHTLKGTTQLDESATRDAISRFQTHVFNGLSQNYQYDSATAALYAEQSTAASASFASYYNSTIGYAPYPADPWAIYQAQSYYTTPAGYELSTGYTDDLDPFGRPVDHWSQWLKTASPSRSALINGANVYDPDGNTLTRGVAYSVNSPFNSAPNNGLVIARHQDLEYDALGRLTRVLSSVGGVPEQDWRALYDGLGRRIKTLTGTGYQSSGGGSFSASTETSSYFDPEVEFLEIGFKDAFVSTDTFWKLYGPDVSGSYGGAQGIGGLEGVMRDSDGSVEWAVNDLHGNTAGWFNDSSAVQWRAANVDAYGLPSNVTTRISGALTLQNTLWQGRRMDSTGLYWIGARYYDPFHRRFLTPDPLGHASDPTLYAYADFDPVNQIDPDGRFAAGAQGLASSAYNAGYNNAGYQQFKNVGGTYVEGRDAGRMAGYNAKIALNDQIKTQLKEDHRRESNPIAYLPTKDLTGLAERLRSGQVEDPLQESFNALSSYRYDSPGMDSIRDVFNTENGKKFFRDSVVTMGKEMGKAVLFEVGFGFLGMAVQGARMGHVAMDVEAGIAYRSEASFSSKNVNTWWVGQDGRAAAEASGGTVLRLSEKGSIIEQSADAARKASGYQKVFIGNGQGTTFWQAELPELLNNMDKGGIPMIEFNF